ncbi:MAG: hypothetical protein ABI600_21200 [Luteolibacter sp.]
MILHHKRCLILLCALLALSSSGCVTRRTVTQGGEVVSKKYVIHRPLSN